MRVLTYTTLYPNAVQTRHGIFVESRLRRLVETGQLQARVVAPVPWFPFRQKMFGAWRKFAMIEEQEVRHGIEIAHPRYPVIPKIGMSVAPFLLASSTKAMLKSHSISGDGFQLIDAHYFYPDGVAAALLGEWLDKPVVVTARGSDVNVIAQYAIPRNWIRWAANKCQRIITVSDDLRNKIIDLGVAHDKVETVPNGVDLTLFRPIDRSAVRHRLNIGRDTLLSVGNLVPLKGHDIVLQALKSRPATDLIIVGQGPLESELRNKAASLGVADRTRFVGNLTQETLVEYYNAADALILASASEGMPNVVLEALACGTPVVATSVGGIPEVLNCGAAGELMDERNSASLLDALRRLESRKIHREDIRAYAKRYAWEPIIRRQLQIYRGLTDL